MSNVFTQCFKIQQQPTHTRKRLGGIDRSMIGNPTNFQHTAHIGSSDVDSNGSSHLGAVQNQMQTKGGYSEKSCPMHLNLIDVQVPAAAS